MQSIFEINMSTNTGYQENCTINDTKRTIFKTLSLRYSMFFLLKTNAWLGSSGFQDLFGTKKYGYSVSAKSDDFCPRLRKLDILPNQILQRSYRAGVWRLSHRHSPNLPYSFGVFLWSRGGLVNAHGLCPRREESPAQRRVGAVATQNQFGSADCTTQVYSPTFFSTGTFQVHQVRRAVTGEPTLLKQGRFVEWLYE